MHQILDLFFKTILKFYDLNSGNSKNDILLCFQKVELH